MMCRRTDYDPFIVPLSNKSTMLPSSGSCLQDRRACFADSRQEDGLATRWETVFGDTAEAYGPQLAFRNRHLLLAYCPPGQIIHSQCLGIRLLDVSEMHLTLTMRRCSSTALIGLCKISVARPEWPDGTCWASQQWHLAPGELKLKRDTQRGG